MVLDYFLPPSYLFKNSARGTGTVASIFKKSLVISMIYLLLEYNKGDRMVVLFKICLAFKWLSLISFEILLFPAKNLVEHITSSSKFFVCLSCQVRFVFNLFQNKEEEGLLRSTTHFEWKPPVLFMCKIDKKNTNRYIFRITCEDLRRFTTT